MIRKMYYKWLRKVLIDFFDWYTLKHFDWHDCIVIEMKVDEYLESIKDKNKRS